MEEELKKVRPEVRIRAFRAIDEPETCELFIQGHTQVLTSIGVTKVTSSKNGWAKNPDAFVIIVESLNGKEVFGGARVHVAGGTEPLPIEQATGALDSSIHDLVWKYAQYGTGEICGLWNSQDLAGYGIGTPLLIRTLIAISSQLGIQSLFALCAPYTVKPVVNCGMVLIESIGNRGTFYYPKLDLIATAMILNEVATLGKALGEDKTSIFQMRESPNNLRINELKNREITIDFELQIPNLDKWDLSQAIESAFKTYQLKNKIDEKEPTFF
ncbi:hypothetical protein ACPPVU_03345 [Mucilaginibacter sp. McL0603]|uniref:hypothetical protein n=1 Tax=Mucilaginibacter sp. McL0603 TaxID=3415670 RepID=UPI003CF39E2A